MSLVDQELLTFPEHLDSPPILWIKCTHCPFSILRIYITEHRNSQIRSVGINIVDSICMLTSYFWAFSGPICSYKNTHNMLYMMTIRSKSSVYMWQECVDWESLTWGNNTQWGVSNDITDRAVLFRECSEITGQHADGVYNIYPDESDLAIPVFCDMHTENGKWTVSTFYPSSNPR
jgi:hypothetical protein